MPTPTSDAARTARTPLQVLDPTTMGRPVHRLSAFTDRIREDLAEFFRLRVNRRYRAGFEIGAVTLTRCATAQNAQRWLTYSGGGARAGFAVERNVLLCILGYRYGTQEPASLTTLEPETATEERLAGMLGAQLLALVAERIEKLKQKSDDASAAADISFNEVTTGGLTGDVWTLRAQILEPTRQIEGALSFRLDETWMARLLKALAPERERVSSHSMNAAEVTQPLPTRLQLTLIARLLQKRVTVGTLMDLRVGDVIPVTFDSSDVLIGDARLFTATVSEHKGKLWLTSFVDVE